MGYDADNEPSNTIRAVERALDVLLCFTAETPTLTMTQISEKVGIHKSTIHRILATLEKKRFVRREPDTGIYRLGIRLLQMANLSLEDINIRHISLPYMRQLSEEFRENVDLAILDRDEVMFVDTFESSQPVKIAALPGQHLPAYHTASGKAILSLLSEDIVTQIYNKYNLDTDSAREMKLQNFLQELKSIRERGYALDCEDLEPGVNAVAAPILGINHKPIASLAVAGPAYRLSLELMHEIGLKLLETTAEITSKISSGN